VGNLARALFHVERGLNLRKYARSFLAVSGCLRRAGGKALKTRKRRKKEKKSIANIAKSIFGKS